MTSVTFSVEIPMSGGVTLRANLYRPCDSGGPWPVIVSMTPYGADSLHDIAMRFALHDYAFLAVDVRGRGNSSGRFRPNLQEIGDGPEVVAWATAQPFCDGTAGMYGGSYCGHAQWVTAAAGLPRLKTIVPIASPCFGVDIWGRGNIVLAYALRWLALVEGRAAHHGIFADERYWARCYHALLKSGLPFRALGQLAGLSSDFFQEWLSHPCVDDYWDSYNPSAEGYANVDMPVLTITGIYDGDQLGALAHYRRHLAAASPEARGSHYLVIGPWDHDGTRAPKSAFGGIAVGATAQVDITLLTVQWHDHVLRGAPRPELLASRMCYYLPGADQWRFADSLEAATGETRALYLGSRGRADSIFHSGTLSDAPADGPPDRYIWDPLDLAGADDELERLEPSTVRPMFPVDRLTDQWSLLADGRSHLVYHGAPVPEPLEIAGFFRLVLWLSIDQPDTDFLIQIFAVSPDGTSIFLASDMKRARHRESLRHEQLISSPVPLEYVFDSFNFTARALEKGGRLRLVVGPVDSIHFQRNRNSGRPVSDETAEEARPVTVSLHHDAGQRSILHVPVAAKDRQGEHGNV